MNMNHLDRETKLQKDENIFTFDDDQEEEEEIQYYSQSQCQNQQKIQYQQQNQGIRRQDQFNGQDQQYWVDFKSQSNKKDFKSQFKREDSKPNKLINHNKRQLVNKQTQHQSHPISQQNSIQKDIFQFQDQDQLQTAQKNINQPNIDNQNVSNPSQITNTYKQKSNPNFKKQPSPVSKQPSPFFTPSLPSQSSPNSQFSSLKSKILFKQQNNFVTPRNVPTQNKSIIHHHNHYNLPNKFNHNSQLQNNSTQSLKNKQNFNTPQSNNLTSKAIPSLTQNQSFQQFKQKQNLQLNYSIQGAKIRTPQTNTAQRFQYVEQQKAIKVANLKQFLFTQLSEQYKVNVLIKKVDQGGFLGKFVNKTKYFVTIEQNNKFLFSVTKQGFNKFIFSMNKDDVSTKNKNYLGQLISKDFSNTQFQLYDYGFDPKQTKCLQFSFKQLAWIKYQQSSGPRKFNVVVSTNNQGFHSIENDVNVIEKKWNQIKDRKNLCKLYSKEPELDQSDGNFKLDFKGMIGKPSVKNFVLSSQEFEDCLMFARRSEDTYALEVKSPFSLMQAVAICISSIYHKSVF